MRLIRRIVLTISVMLASFVPITAPLTVHAVEGIEQNLCAGANLDVNTDCDHGGITDQQAKDRINNILHTVINLFSIVVGVVAVIMIIVGGLKYITSGGDSGNVSGAKNTILYAIIGIVVVALSQFIVRFVLTKINQ